jgi:hypothetical protein
MSTFELPFELPSNHLRTLFELCASHTPPYPPYSSKGEFEPPSKGVHSPPNFYEGFFLRFSFHALSEFARRSGMQAGRCANGGWAARIDAEIKYRRDDFDRDSRWQ